MKGSRRQLDHNKLISLTFRLDTLILHLALRRIRASNRNVGKISFLWSSCLPRWPSLISYISHVILSYGCTNNSVDIKLNCRLSLVIVVNHDTAAEPAIILSVSNIVYIASRETVWCTKSKFLARSSKWGTSNEIEERLWHDIWIYVHFRLAGQNGSKTIVIECWLWVTKFAVSLDDIAMIGRASLSSLAHCSYV